MKTSESKVAYEAPEVEIIEVKVEKGFAVTGGNDNDLDGFGNGGSF